ncbi:splicing factor 45, partial [Phenoliferia sp. Uapishka_3]
MSLYGGISFDGKVKADDAQPAQPASTSTPSTPAAVTPTADADKPKSTWSAALRFAPTIRKRPTPSPASSIPLAFKSAFSSADDSASPSNLGPRIVGRAKAALSTPTLSAPPSLLPTPSPALPPAPEPVFAARQGRILKPPSMTLDADDVNGFRQSAAGKKASGAAAKKGKGKKNAQKKEDPNLAFTSVAYDPARPCDYPYDFLSSSTPPSFRLGPDSITQSAYKLHVQVIRAQRRNEREAELRRARSASGSSYESSDGEASEKESDRPANKKSRFNFAPPSSYNNSPPPESAQPSAPPSPPAPTILEAPNPLSAPKGETGEEAYLRRLAMSQGGRPAPAPRAPSAPSYPSFAPVSTTSSYSPATSSAGPQAYPSFAPASNTNMSAGPQAYPPPPPPSGPSAGPQAFPSFSPSGSMSSGPQAYPSSAGPQAYPTFAPASTSTDDSGGSSFFPSPQPPPSFYPPPPTSYTPPESSNNYFSPSDEMPPFRPAPTTSFDPAAGGPPAGNVQLSEAAAKARDIAQRLSKLAGTQPPPTPVQEAPSLVASTEPDNRPFADRMMSKFGWTEGKGLGASESGMTSALSVSKAPTPSSKKGKGKKQDANKPPPPVGMAAAAKGGARIVDAAREGRVATQTAAVGEPSRVVLLTNLCGIDDVDDDLGDEVAEEANKFGVVERCFVYLVPGETRDDEGVRIFLVMSGLAGGWNAVRQFDGRFFGGRVVKARFYDEATFNAGEHRY